LWVNGVVVVDPALDHCKCGMSIADHGHTNIVAFDGLHDGFRRGVKVLANSSVVCQAI
jgi:hypothetical protein